MPITNTERLAKLEEKVDGVREDIADIKKILDNLDSRYASKLTEKILYTMIGIVLTSVMYALLSGHIK